MSNVVIENYAPEPKLLNRNLKDESLLGNSRIITLGTEQNTTKTETSSTRLWMENG